MKHSVRSLSALALIAALAGCKVGPNYKRPTVNTPSSYRGALAPDIAPPTNATPLGAQKWNTVFTDPVLQQLITEALKNNYDVQIAADRVLEQQAQVGITKAAQYPTLNVGATYDALGLPSSLLNSVNASSNSSNNNGQTNYYAGGITASVAWNLDFWGMYRRQTEAARANLRATEWAKQTTYATLVENIATSYYQLRTLDAELAITRSTLDARKQSLDSRKSSSKAALIPWPTSARLRNFTIQRRRRFQISSGRSHSRRITCDSSRRGPRAHRT